MGGQRCSAVFHQIKTPSLLYNCTVHSSINQKHKLFVSSSNLSLPINSVSMAPASVNRWIRPEVWPLFAAVGAAVGICGLQLVRNIYTNPEVRVTKENRGAGVLDNHAEGERYAEHFIRKFVRGKSPEIMPGINSFFADPEKQ